MFEVGKKYRDGEGKIITITGTTSSNSYPIQGRNDSTDLNSYSEGGHFYDDCRYSVYNLIEGEVTDTLFKVGSKYYTRNGDVAKIIKSTEGLTYTLDVEIKSQIYSFTTEGKFYNTGLDDGYDLMFDQGVVEEDTVEVEPESYEEIVIGDVVVSKTFSNQQDVWAYLMLGGLVQNTINSEVYGFYRGILTEYDIHGDTKFSLLVVPCDIGFTYTNQWVKHTPVEKAAPRWEDNLQSNTVLCWVSDQDDTFDMLRLVKAYVKGDNYPYKDKYDNTWAYATPLTLENVTPLIYECQKA
jgi:hypothetical protein